MPRSPRCAGAFAAGALLIAALTAGCGAVPADAQPGNAVVRAPTARASPTPRSAAPRSAARASAKPSNPFAGASLYVPAAAVPAGLSAGERTAVSKLDGVAQATWFGSEVTAGAVGARVAALTGPAATAGKLPLLVAYDIPFRDCGGFSGGGAADGPSYLAWIRAFASGIGSRPAAVVLEPDALASVSCLTAAQQKERYALLASAVDILRAGSATSVYLDAGNGLWNPTAVIVQRLQWAGIARATGFSVNVSNFDATPSEERYGDAISAQVGGKHFVVDTSRNGRGAAPGNAWCNPTGRALGARPGTPTGDPLADALLWIKHPGRSDGPCGRGEPKAGVFWPAYALGLTQRSAW